MQDFSFSNLNYVDAQYRKYVADPTKVDPSWRYFFEGWQFAQQLEVDRGSSVDLKAGHLVEAYRTYGHLKAHFNCLMSIEEAVVELSPKTYGIEEGDWDALVQFKKERVPLRRVKDLMEKTYCSKIGFEYMGVQSSELKALIQKEIESEDISLKAEEKRAIFEQLNKAELFEVFLHTKYVGQKRFSLEGGETLIPMLQTLVREDGAVNEVVLAMAHRGRLNVLANLLNKSYESIFHEFEDFHAPDLSEGTGDVKYHKGFVAQLSRAGKGDVSLELCANPSHLEAVDPVLEGKVYGRQFVKDKLQVLPVLIHGDASIAGQGIVYETLQLGKLIGYETGGTVHIVVNNQIGFTTLPKDSRSTRYCTDIAHAFSAPVFHVNGEDPEGCIYATRLALKIRQKFQIDVFIDLNCYRKYGHNEGDEPAFTQPVQNKEIREKKTARSLYLEKLVQEGVMTPEDVRKAEEGFRSELQKALDNVASIPPPANLKVKVVQEEVQTNVPEQTLRQLAEAFCQIPTGFSIHPKVQKLQAERLSSLNGKIDWGMGEHLAYASLLAEGVPIRISGQDSRRGTFSHRHAVWVDQKTGERYYPLSHLQTNKAPFDVFNSPLAEFAVLGFEFGYTLARPEALVIWEAQYGDFSNGAQVIIDQFISCSEQKWQDRSRLVLFLPHGYEGGGPEHSSARLERFLQLSGDNDWTVANCTTPSQLFHLLRRQVKQKEVRPLILMTPKALLRHPLCTSTLKEFSEGKFQEVIGDSEIQNPEKVIFCSGKVYYDLLAAREKRNVALIRIEQLYPLSTQKISDVIQSYSKASSFCWVQEESRNMGAWSYIYPELSHLFPKPLQYIGREASSSTAAGCHALHETQLKQFIQEAF